LTVARDATDEKELPQLHLTYQSDKEKIKHRVKQISERGARQHFPINIVEALIDPLERIGSGEWLDQSTGDILTIEEVLFKYGDFLPEELRLPTEPLPEKIRQVLDKTNVSLIETQRLFTKSSKKAHAALRRRFEARERITVEEYSNDLIKNVQHQLRESGTLSASLDRDFPRRLLETALPTEATEEKIRDLYVEQSDYRDRLMKAGLMKPEQQVPLPTGELSQMERKVLWIYLTDVQHKLELFDTLLLRAELLREIINSRFSYKKFELDAEDGFVFKSDHDISRVPLRDLSSGEQHELVLSYDLLFKTQKKALVLIDEPELSLHVSWQRKFLEDIGKIAKLADLDFLIATHSPSIIHNRRDLMVGLGEDA